MAPWLLQTHWHHQKHHHSPEKYYDRRTDMIPGWLQFLGFHRPHQPALSSGKPDTRPDTRLDTCLERPDRDLGPLQCPDFLDSHKVALSPDRVHLHSPDRIQVALSPDRIVHSPTNSPTQASGSLHFRSHGVSSSSNSSTDGAEDPLASLEAHSTSSSPTPASGRLFSQPSLSHTRRGTFRVALAVFSFLSFCIAVIGFVCAFNAYFGPYVFLDDVDSLLIRKAAEANFQISAPVNQLVPATDLPESVRRFNHPQTSQPGEDREDVVLEKLSLLSQLSIQALEGEGSSSSSSSGTSSQNASMVTDPGKPNNRHHHHHRQEQKPLPFKAPDFDLTAGKPPKIAFLFLTRGPLPLRRLWEEFFRGNMERATIYVHASTKGFSVDAHVGNDSAFHGTQIPGIRIVRGTPSMIQATRRLLASALQDPANQRFVFLSEACIPIRHFNFIYTYLFTGDRSFLALLPTLRWWRFPRYFWIFVPRQVLHPWQLKKGSQWFVLTRPHAALVVENLKWYLIFGRGRGEYPDESYIQTVVWGYDRRGIEPHSVTHVDWPYYKSEHPAMYSGSRITREIIERMQRRHFPVSEAVSLREVSFPGPCRVAGELAPCFLFARKFAADAVDGLMAVRDTLGY